MENHLLRSLKQQLKYEIVFVTNVSNPYFDSKTEVETVDFEYKGQNCQLVSNGSLRLRKGDSDIEVNSYQDLVYGLIG